MNSDNSWFLALGIGLILGCALCFSVVKLTFAISASGDSIGLRTESFCGYKGNWIHIRVDNQGYGEQMSTCAHEVAHSYYWDKYPLAWIEYQTNPDKEEKYAYAVENCVRRET